MLGCKVFGVSVMVVVLVDGDWVEVIGVIDVCGFGDFGLFDFVW